MVAGRGVRPQGQQARHRVACERRRWEAQQTLHVLWHQRTVSLPNRMTETQRCSLHARRTPTVLANPRPLREEMALSLRVIRAFPCIGRLRHQHPRQHPHQPNDVSSVLCCVLTYIRSTRSGVVGAGKAVPFSSPPPVVPSAGTKRSRKYQTALKEARLAFGDDHSVEEEPQQHKIRKRAAAVDNDDDDGDDGDDSDGCDVSPPASPILEPATTDVEMQRLALIRQNEAVLASLNLPTAPKPTPQALKPTQRGISSKRKSSQPVPRRQSSRLRGLGVDGTILPETPDTSFPVSTDESLREERVESEFALLLGADGARELHLKKVRDDKRAQAQAKRGATSAEDQPAKQDEETEAEEEEDEGDAAPRQIREAFDVLLRQQARAVKPIVLRSPMDKEKYEKLLPKYSLVDTAVAKVVKDRIYSMAVHPSTDKLLVLAGDKWGRLGVMDVGKPDGETCAASFRLHGTPLTSILFDSNNPAKLYTSAYEGVVRAINFESGQTNAAMLVDDDAQLSYSDLDVQRSCLYGALSNGQLCIADVKQGSTPVNVLQAHNRKTSHVHVCPSNNNLVATSSNDHTVKLWDARNLKPKAALATLVHNRAVSSAIFNYAGTKLVTTSHDDFVRIWSDMTSGQPNAAPTRKIKHNNHTGRWLTNFKAIWDPMTDDHVIIGSMGRPRSVDIFDATTGKRAVKLEHDELFNSVTSLHACHPSAARAVIAGGNSSGRIFVWQNHSL
eukprot:m.346213 g.346213  ORF g.346213 m.346213 type:complete len:729 (+) comp19861_c0_seq9:372-2558(+)